MSRDIAPFGLRMPAELKARVEQAARESGRSANAQVVHMLQTYFNRIDSDVDELHAALDRERANISPMLSQPQDRLAALKVLLLEEVMVLRARIADLGGLEAVLKADKAELVRKITGPRLTGTPEERMSHFSRVVGQTPLTALLTADELSKLAAKVVELQDSQKELISTTRSDKTVLLRPLAADAPEKSSATPRIPGVNAPKRGLGSSKTATPKQRQPKPKAVKKKFTE